MMTDTPRPSIGWFILRIIFSLTVSLGLLAGSAFAVYKIYQSEPTAEREGATRKSAALVETIRVSIGDHSPQIMVLGPVEPTREIDLSARVGGEVIKVHPGWEPGGIIKENQPLLEIDPADLKLELRQRQQELKQKQSALAIEQGRQTVAKKEFESLGEQIDPKNRALVLREPQVDAIQAEIEVAKSMIDRVKLDLERTKVTAPFDAQILSRSANMGTQVAAGEAVARLVGTDKYWIVAMVPLRSLHRIAFPKGDQPGSDVQVRLNRVWATNESRKGEVTRLVGEIDQESRTAQVLITVKDPLGLTSGEKPLLLGMLVETRIQGKPIKNVVRLRRAYLRKNDTVWVMKDGKLEIRKAEIVFRDSKFVYIAKGLSDGEAVVTTTLSSVSNGSPLRRMEEASGGNQPNPEGAE